MPEGVIIHMWAKVMVLSLVILGASATGAAGTSLDLDSTSSAQVDSVLVSAGESSLTSVEPDRPAIDFNQHGARGIAPNTRVVIGDIDQPSNDHAFALHNDGDEPRRVAISYTYNRQPPETAGVFFTVVDSDGTILDRTHDGDGPVVNLPAGETFYVVVVIDTTGATVDDDLSGSLEFITS